MCGIRSASWWLRAAFPKTLLFVCVVSAVSVSRAQESANFRLERITIAASAGPATSASYSTTITIAQEGPVGSVSRCNDGFLQSTGFWSVLGESPAPVWLNVGRNAVDPTEVDLLWSGSSSQFSVYRGELADSVPEPWNLLLTTSDCSVTDAPPSVPITYYLVRATGM